MSWRGTTLRKRTRRIPTFCIEPRSVEDEKLQKVLAREGLGSRREIERWISAGRVRVNGKAAAIGTRIGPQDEVKVDGDVVRRAARATSRVLMYNKPEGEVCTRRDTEGRRTVFERLPALAGGRWLSVGRLDINTQGLLLFTNDGELNHRLTHPSSSLVREYAVRVLGEVEPGAFRNLLDGVELDDGPARFTSLRDAGGDGANHWYNVTLEEGRNREVHRLWASQGVRVSRLIRVRYGPVQLPRWLRTGRYSELEGPALGELFKAARLRRPVPRSSVARATRARKRVSRLPARKGS